MAEDTNTTDPGGKTEREAAREKLSAQVKMFGLLARTAVKTGAVKSAKLAMPIMHGYVGTQPQKLPDEGADDVVVTNRLSEDEWSTVKAAAAKLAFEGIELASLAYPTVEGIEPYRAVKDEKGQYRAPHLGQLISIGTAVQRLFADNEDQAGDSSDQIGGDSEVNVLATKEPVLLTAVTPDEYGYLNAPVQPRTIRRVALNERDMMFMNRSDAAQSTKMALTAGPVPGSSSMKQSEMMVSNQNYTFGTRSMMSGGSGGSAFKTSQVSAAQTCASCGCSMTAPTTSVARYNDDGTCADTNCISCETKWRMRDCLKLAFCEFITCVADEFCVDGKFQKPKEENGDDKDIGDVLLCCLGDAMCSTLQCLPTAICGPRQENQCIPPPVLECNFAVEERS